MARTNIDINDKLLKEAMDKASFKTKKELINCALAEFVNKLKRKSILKFMGCGCWEGSLTKMRENRV
ncbi:MAG: type II toxin-antitoxin system VapB family antitoxin [Candidatus Omnitrophota bacterium]|nr:type II toxin-antitoxin system VapB family antitoxin [Candidatus Omnitrophota bacterium]